MPLSARHFKTGTGDYHVVESSLQLARIDVGNFIICRDWAQEAGFSHGDFHADWLFIKDVIARQGRRRTGHVEEVLFVHN